MSRRQSSEVLALTLLVAAVGCSEPLPDTNFLLITIDTLRADHLGTYGYFRDTSPTLDALAAESVVFERCLAPIPRTAPSHTSLLTGVYPLEHGITSNVGRRKSEEITEGEADTPEARLWTLPRYMQERGYRTGGFVSATPLKRSSGIDAGFDAYTDPRGHRRPAKETIADAQAWLDAGTGPFFLWLHFFDPHGPFDDTLPLPKAYRRRYRTDAGLRSYLSERRFAEQVSNKNYKGAEVAELVNLYDACIRYLDDQLALFFADLRQRGEWDRTLIVVTSDHGEGLGQHDFAGHGLVWGEQLHVPLFMRAPGQAPRRADALLSLIDVLPTAMGLAPELAVPAFMNQARGRDVLAEGEPGWVFGMSSSGQGETTLVQGHWKYVLREERGDSLFDLAADPFELRDLDIEEAERAAAMRAELGRALADMTRMGAIYGAGDVVDTTDPDAIAELKALGYLGGDEDGDDHE